MNTKQGPINPKLGLARSDYLKYVYFSLFADLFIYVPI